MIRSLGSGMQGSFSFCHRCRCSSCPPPAPWYLWNPSGVLELGSWDRAGCRNLWNPSGVLELGGWDRAGCRNLWNPSGVLELGSWDRAGCRNLWNPSGVLELGSWDRAGCQSWAWHSALPLLPERWLGLPSRLFYRWQNSCLR